MCTTIITSNLKQFNACVLFAFIFMPIQTRMNKINHFKTFTISSVKSISINIQTKIRLKKKTISLKNKYPPLVALK